jgi:hypothetical protein
MKHLILTLAALIALSMPAHAACYVDYKAKKDNQDNPLQFHYGVAEVACGSNPKADLAARLSANGWTLLAIVSRFGEKGLAERQASAANYFLRF